MQTFVPYPDFEKSAMVLDTSRLGKQRSETMIIYNTLIGTYEEEGRKGWPHHPAVLMWKGCELGLLHYGLAVCSEWQRRGYADNGTLDWFADRIDWLSDVVLPAWWGQEPVHRSHRSQLLGKDPEYYMHHFPREEAGLPYVWPVR